MGVTFEVRSPEACLSVVRYAVVGLSRCTTAAPVLGRHLSFYPALPGKGQLPVTYSSPLLAEGEFGLYSNFCCSFVDVAATSHQCMPHHVVGMSALCTDRKCAGWRGQGP